MNFNLKDAAVAKSYTPMNPGEQVPAAITSVEISEDGDLDINFEGVSAENPGFFNHRIWANTFDPNNDKFDQKVAEDEVARIRHIMEAYLSDEEVLTVGGDSWSQLAKSVKNALTTNGVGVDVTLKLVYKSNSDEKIAFPKFGNVISSVKRPKALKLGTKTPAGSNIPYDRVEKMEFYGVVPSAGSPSETVANPFGAASSNESVPAFGTSDETLTNNDPF